MVTGVTSGSKARSAESTLTCTVEGSVFICVQPDHMSYCFHIFSQHYTSSLYHKEIRVGYKRKREIQNVMTQLVLFNKITFRIREVRKQQLTQLTCPKEHDL